MTAASSARLKFEPAIQPPISLPEAEPVPRVSAILFGICSVLCFGVLAFGAVETWSSSILEAGTAVLFLAWAARTVMDRGLKIQASPLYAPAFLFAAVVA